MRKVIIFIIIVLLGFGCNKTSDINKAKKMITEQKYFEAINILESIEVHNANSHFLLGEAYKGIRKFVIADSFYMVALKENQDLKDDIVNSYSSIAMTDFMKGFNYNAIRFWKKILDMDPDYDINIGYYYLGKHYYDQEKYYEAKPLLINAINISIPSVSRINTYKMIINIYKMNLKYDTAYIYVKQARDEFGVSNNPDQNFSIDMGEIIFKIAQTRYKNGEMNEAINLLNEFISVEKPRSLLDDAYLLLGNIYFDLKEYHKAIPAYNKVKELNNIKLYGSQDTYIEANNKLRKIAERTGK